MRFHSRLQLQSSSSQDIRVLTIQHKLRAVFPRGLWRRAALTHLSSVSIDLSFAVSLHAFMANVSLSSCHANILCEALTVVSGNNFSFTWPISTFGEMCDGCYTAIWVPVNDCRSRESKLSANHTIVWNNFWIIFQLWKRKKKNESEKVTEPHVPRCT